MKYKTKKIILPLTVIAVTVVLVFLMKGFAPQAKRSATAAKAMINVSVQNLVAEDYQLLLESFGTVRPGVQSLLVAQASGQIISVSEQFREGGFFAKDDVLLRLDDRDHRAEVKSAQASVLTAVQGLQEEQARAKQAAIDWQRLGNGEKANNLVLREPQLAAAQAALLSAQAQLDKAEINLQRTKIIAPFAGRVLNRSVDLGQVVSHNMQLATLYSIDSVEVRLPIKNSDLAFIILPEQFRDAVQAEGSVVEFRSDLVGEQVWQGKIVSTEGAIDEDAQQLYVVAEIIDPYKARPNNQYPIKIGQYVKAKIQGKVVSDALVIPNAAIYQGSYVYVVENGFLQRKTIRLAWQNGQQALVAEGLSVGEQLVVTSLGQVNSGTAVNVIDANSKQLEQSTGSMVSGAKP